MANQYARHRAKVNPPHVSLADLRMACGLTLEQVCQRVNEATGANLTRGGLSGIENGHRGASADTIAGLEQAFGLKAGSMDTDYQPRNKAAA